MLHLIFNIDLNKENTYKFMPLAPTHTVMHMDGRPVWMTAPLPLVACYIYC